MRRFVVILFALCAIIKIPGVAFAQPVADVHITILHTNDTHGHLLPYSYPETYDADSDVGKLAVRHDIGGAARRGVLVKRIRAEKDHSTLLIDAGDICDGTPFSTEYHGDADIAAMNAIGYDVACPGNHEYNNTLIQVRKMIAEAKFPLVSANSKVKADGKPLYTPYVIKVIDGVRIAYFGLITYDARSYPAANNALIVEQPIETAKRLVPELRKAADLVVAITHIGVDEDIKLAAEVPGIDLIVGGHSHTLLPRPIVVPHPLDKTPNSIHGTLIVQDFQWAGTLGRLDLIVHHVSGGKATIERYNGKLLPITGGLPDDKDVATVVDKYWKPISAKYGKVVGEAAGDFAEKGQDLAEYNLVADSIRDQTGVDFEMENLGGVRSELAKGPITFGDLVTLDPFGDTIVTFHATGAQIKTMLISEQPAVSGISYAYDRGHLTSATIGGKPIEDSKIYFGAANSYLAGSILKDITDKADTKKTRIQAVQAYIQKNTPVKPAYDGRRVVSGEGD
jgi:2',3'-cyclic-nucleotide 2'-phosphodiesterase (5'-nucleotidase family)